MSRNSTGRAEAPVRRSRVPGPAGIVALLTAVLLGGVACPWHGDRATTLVVTGQVTGPRGDSVVDVPVVGVWGLAGSRQSDLTDETGTYELFFADLGAGRRRGSVTVWVEPDPQRQLRPDTVRREDVLFTPTGEDTLRVDFELESG